MVATSSTRDLPSGTVTFLFTDVEGSTRLLHELGEERYAEALAEHRRIVLEACATTGGVEVDTQGDAFFFAFPTAPAALAAARSMTEALASGAFQVRVGIHTGAPLLTEEGYVGHDVHLAARLAASAHGGQVVLTKGTAALVDGEWPLRDLGEHRLKDLAEALTVFQLGEEGFSPLATTPSLPSSIDFRILGPLEVVAAEGPLALGGHKQRALLGLLLIRAGEVVSNDRLVQELWGEQPPRTATSSLHNLVVGLRKLLGPDVLVTRPPGYVLCIDREQLDLGRFERLLTEAKGAEPPRQLELLQEALSLWRGPPLADLAFEGFAQGEIRRLEELRLDALEELLEAELALDEGAGLLPELEALVAEHPLRERLRSELMLALYRDGRQTEALAAYEAARHTLSEELGVGPGPALRELHAAIVRQEPSLLAAAVVPAATNLPRPLSSFVGRERELDEVSSLLSGGARLLTLHGAGGSGKTRLAIEVAARLTDAYKDGTFWVGLAPLRDSTLVTGTIAQTLGARDDLILFIGEQRMLVLVDNFEQVAEAGTELARVLEGCPNLTFLVTSRELLRVRGEVEYEVQPLSDSEAVELFHERSRSVVDKTVAYLCTRLDNLPLAVELAAARTSVLTPAQILDHLSEGLDLLRGGRDAEARQRTLRATIEWSYELLSPEEQHLFARLAVFAGGCTLEAAQEICDADIDTLQSLVDKSLLRFAHGRFLMLETVREYTAELLEASGEGAEIRLRHAEFFTRHAERLGLEMSDDAVLTLAEDEGNLRSALSFSSGGREPEVMLRLAGALGRYWENRCQFHEARRWLEEAVRQGQSCSTWARARALHNLAFVKGSLWDFAAARIVLGEALRLSTEVGDDNGAGMCLSQLGWLAIGESNLELAETLFEKSAALRGEQGRCQSLINRAALATLRGQLDEARTLDEELLTIAQAESNDYYIASALLDLAWIAALDQRFDDAARLASESLNFDLRVGQRLGVAEAMLIGALVNGSRGFEDDAARLVGAGAAQRQRLDQRPFNGPIYERAFQELEREIGEDRFAAPYAAGAALAFDDAVELARRAFDVRTT